MKIKVNFGLVDTKIVEWWTDVNSFPKLIKYLGKNFEWVFYDTDKSKQVEYILTFSEIQSYDPNYGVACTSWNDLFGENPVNGCECGSKYDRHSPDGHLFYCRLYRRY